MDTLLTLIGDYGTAWVTSRLRLAMWMRRGEQLLERYGVAFAGSLPTND